MDDTGAVGPACGPAGGRGPCGLELLCLLGLLGLCLRYVADGARRRAQQRLRYDEYGLDTAVDVGLEPYVDAVPPGELGHHEQTDPAVLEEAGHIHLIGVGEQRVHLVLFAQGHAQAPVLDLDREAGGDEVDAQQDLGVRGGEHRGVLDEFGQQVDDVGDGVPAQGAVDRGHQFDPRVLLDLGDRGPQHLGHGDGVAPLAARDGAAEHGEVLGV